MELLSSVKMLHTLYFTGFIVSGKYLFLEKTEKNDKRHDNDNPAHSDKHPEAWLTDGVFVVAVGEVGWKCDDNDDVDEDADGQHIDASGREEATYLRRRCFF